MTDPYLVLRPNSNDISNLDNFLLFASLLSVLLKYFFHQLRYILDFSILSRHCQPKENNSMELYRTLEDYV